MSKSNERGAVAVEFALLAPVLVMLLLGIMEFGRAYNVQVSLSSAAREGVRVMAITNNPTGAKTAVKNAAVAVQPGLTDTNITVTPNVCTSGTQVTVKVSYTLSTLTGIAGPFPLEGTGVMLCGG
ncbi:TadE/TadG family type IV pilus assembly protein [Arthrobacter sp. YD4]|uniref:TadE/TadG family type IV pilus assembly protein n=1 Tax=Arthrobacter sp. YD4 TaxID=3058043 RepID=UPI0025B381C5|nr:TadE/TadG family type IV pilus assembly protein [Arthrobacter sp. YD4]MDN3934952.1 TadE/TadG family type IV pilus assembly protein [Arthrobacter sp. YD4]